MAKKIVIVGGVAGGANAATRARRLSEQAEILVLERGEYVSFANCGLPYYVGNEIKERKKLILVSPDTFKQRFNIEVRVNSTVVRVQTDKKSVYVREAGTGREYCESYDELILAPGAAPVRPPLPGIDHPRVFSVRTIPDVDGIVAALPAGSRGHALVIGGGFIGLEMVEQFKHRGLDVTLVQATDQVLPPFDREMTLPLHRELEARGVKLLLNQSIESFAEGKDGGVIATLKSGTKLPADIAIMSIGVRPDVQFLESSGIELGRTGGIKVDDRLRTSALGVWAVGDAIEITHFVTKKPMLIALAGPANRQGRLVADNIFGAEQTYAGTLGTAILRVFELTAASTGANERMLVAQKIPFEKIYLYPNSHAGYYPGAETISLKLLFSPRDGAVLGAQAVGKDGVDKRIDVIATAIKSGLTVDDLADLELAYAPPFGSAKDPINIAGMMAQNVLSGRVRLAHAEQVADLGDALLLDVRDAAEVERGAIPNATHIPLNELRSRLHELDRSREIVAYCQSGQRSYYACRILTQNGFKCRNLSGAYKSWANQIDAERRNT